MENKYLISVVAASKRFGIGRDVLYAMIRSQSDIPVVKIRNVTKINVPLFEEWLNKAAIEKRVIY